MSIINRVILTVLAAGTLAGCGGGGGGPAPTYSLSGSVASAFSGAAVANVAISIKGTSSANTSTNAMGQYSVSGLAPGAYTVTATLTGTTFAPSTLPVTISNAAATGENFLAIRGGQIASGLQILPGTFVSSDQLRASIVQSG